MCRNRSTPYHLSAERLDPRLLPSYTVGPETFLGAGLAPAVLPAGAAVRMADTGGPDGYDLLGAGDVVVQGGPGDQEFPALTARADGSLVLAWTGPDGPGLDTWGVWARAVDAAFAPLGPAVRVDGGLAGYAPTPLVVPQGSGAVSVFWEGVWDGTVTPQWARDLDAALAPLGSPYGEARPVLPPGPITAAVTTAGQILVSFPEGTVIANLTAGPADPFYAPSVAVGPDGSFAVGWTAADYGGCWVRTWTADPPGEAMTAPERYWLGADGRVWSSILAGPVTPNRVKQVLQARTDGGTTLLFAVGLDDRVWRLHVGPGGQAAGSWALLGPERVLGLTAARLDDSHPALVVAGLNGHEYLTTFDVAGDAHDPWHLLA